MHYFFFYKKLRYISNDRKGYKRNTYTKMKFNTQYVLIWYIMYMYNIIIVKFKILNELYILIFKSIKVITIKSMLPLLLLTQVGIFFYFKFIIFCVQPMLLYLFSLAFIGHLSHSGDYYYWFSSVVVRRVLIIVHFQPLS